MSGGGAVRLLGRDRSEPDLQRSEESSGRKRSTGRAVVTILVGPRASRTRLAALAVGAGHARLFPCGVSEWREANLSDSQLVMPEPAVGKVATHRADESGRCCQKGALQRRQEVSF